MFTNVNEFLYPKSPDEVVNILSQRRARALIVAGGTSVSLMNNSKVNTLVDITRIGLDAIEEKDNQVIIGCNVRIQELAKHEGVDRLYNGMLAQASRTVGSRAIRNAVCVGANAVQLFRWSDPPVCLLAMNASFELLGKEGRRTLSADDFFSKHPRQVLKTGEILTKIIIPSPQQTHYGAFLKLSQTSFDLAIVDVAVCLGVEGDKISNARLVIGGTKNVCWRCLDAENQLIGKKLLPSNIDIVAAIARKATETATDVRFSKAYREQMVEVVVKRTLEMILVLQREHA